MVDTFSAAGTGGDSGAAATTVSAQAYLDALTPIMTKVSEQTDGPVQEAADLIVASLRAGGVVQAFGSGHSEALAMEIAGRAGGLVPTNRIALRDVVIVGGELARRARQQAPRARPVDRAPAVRPRQRVGRRHLRDRVELRRERVDRRARAAGEGSTGTG